jgi:hypothetical protein
MPSTPILAKIAVKAAKSADSTAQICQDALMMVRLTPFWR